MIHVSSGSLSRGLRWYRVRNRWRAGLLNFGACRATGLRVRALGFFFAAMGIVWISRKRATRYARAVCHHFPFFFCDELLILTAARRARTTSHTQQRGQHQQQPAVPQFSAYCAQTLPANSWITPIVACGWTRPVRVNSVSPSAHVNGQRIIIACSQSDLVNTSWVK